MQHGFTLVVILKIFIVLYLEYFLDRVIFEGVQIGLQFLYIFIKSLVFGVDFPVKFKKVLEFGIRFSLKCGESGVLSSVFTRQVSSEIRCGFIFVPVS